MADNDDRQSTNTRSSGIAAINVKLDYIKRDIEEIKTRLDNNYVTVQEFEPVKKIVYGLVSLVLIGVVGAIVALVLKA